MTIISAVLTAALAQMPVPTHAQPPATPPAQMPVQPTPMPQSGQQPARPMPSMPYAGRDTLMNSLQGFNIVLLVGESQSSGPSIEDVPPAARKALADMKEFLPFKTYRVLDSQWTLCCSNPGGSFISGRLQGVTAAHSGNEMRLVPRPYSFRLGVRADARLYVTFTLTGDAISGRVEQPTINSARVTQLENQLADWRKEEQALDARISSARAKDLGSNHPDVQNLVAQKDRIRLRIVETMNQVAGEIAHPEVDRSSRALVDNSFTMDVGETVVVGTSRLGGDKALIAIVTAARKSTR